MNWPVRLPPVSGTDEENEYIFFIRAIFSIVTRCQAAVFQPVYIECLSRTTFLIHSELMERRATSVETVAFESFR